MPAAGSHRTGRVHRTALAGAGLCAVLGVAGCARVPPLYAHDGAMVVHDWRNGFIYRRPGEADTRCRFDKTRKITACENGIEAQSVAGGLPFYGVVYVDFDGRRFERAPASPTATTATVPPPEISGAP